MVKEEKWSSTVDTLPEGLSRKINVVPYSIRDFIESAANETPKNSKVLDVGAGECPYKKFFEHCEYTSQDLCVGDSKADYSKIDVVCDIKSLPLDNNTFDVVLNTLVMEHIDEPQKALNECHRVLKKGGKLYMVVPHQVEEHQVPHDYYRYTKYGIDHLLKKSGFKDNKITPIGGYFWFLGNKLGRMPEVLFKKNVKGWKRKLRYIIEIPTIAILGVLILACYYLDSLDHEKTFTIGYKCVSKK